MPSALSNSISGCTHNVQRTWLALTMNLWLCSLSDRIDRDIVAFQTKILLDCYHSVNEVYAAVQPAIYSY